MCYSKAWNSKIVTSAYWVKSNQVSKTAPSGEYLTTGSFMIRGTKNYLPPSNLQMGLALLFRVADESIVNHINERKPKLLSQEEEDREAIERDKLQKRMEDKHESQSSAAPSSEGQSSAVTSADSAAQEKEDESGEEVVDDTLSNDDGTEILHQNEDKSNTNEREDEESDSQSDPAKEALIDQIEQHPPSKEDIDRGDESDDEESFDESDEDEGREDLINSSSSKYSISLVRDEPEEESADTTNNSAQASAESRKKKLSAHERRQLKRQQQGKPVTDQPRPPKAQAKKDKQKPMTRGQKNKMKLIKKKYGNQDAEEREAMMKLLQPAGPAKSEEPESVKPKETKKEVEQQNVEEIKKRTEKRLTTAQKRLAKEKEEEEIRMLLKEEKLELLSDADKKKLEEIEAKGLGVNLAALTGMVRITCSVQLDRYTNSALFSPRKKTS